MESGSEAGHTGMTRTIFLSMLLLCVNAQAMTPFAVQDSSGARVAFTLSPERVISLAPNLTELAYAAGMGERMVAVTAYSDYPQQAAHLPRVGDAFRLDWERLVALKPDLVLAWGSGLSSQDRMNFVRMGIKVLVLEPRDLADIPKALLLLGRIAGTEAVAGAAAQAFMQQLDALRRQYAKRTQVRTYFQIAATPLLTVNDTHIIGDVLRLCGGRNVFAASPLLTLAISDEALVKENPQVMLAAATLGEREGVRNSCQKLPLTAVRRGRVAFIDPDLISRATPRILFGSKQICEQIELARH